MFEFQIAKLSPAAKRLILCISISLFLGFGVALAQVAYKTGLSQDKIILEYRGSEDPELMSEPKSFGSILQTTHSHALSVPIVLALLSFLYLGTSASQTRKKFLITCAFAGFFGDYLGIWLLRYVDASFLYLSAVSHLFGDSAYLIMNFSILRECVRKEGAIQ